MSPAPARRRVFVLSLVGCLFAAGCGGGPVTGGVSGKVTFQSQPVGEGFVELIDAAKGTIEGSAPLKPDGTYAMPKVLAGNYKVQITPPAWQPPAVMKPDDPPAVAPDPANIPRKYRSVETSGLTVTVKAGNTEFPIDMAP